MHSVIHGVVLRETNTKEADKILTVLSKELGKITIIARGVRKKNNALAASSELLTYSEMTVYERGGWIMLSDASAIEHFFPLRGDIEKLSLASYFAELTESLAAEGECADELLPLFLNALYALANLNKHQKLIKSAFELRLMCVEGYEPRLDCCEICGAEEPELPVFDVMHGVLRCRACYAGGGLSLPLSPKALEAMRYVTECEPKKLYSFSLDENSLEQMANACEAFAAAQLERGFKTLDFYKSITF